MEPNQNQSIPSKPLAASGTGTGSGAWGKPSSSPWAQPHPVTASLRDIMDEQTNEAKTHDSNTQRHTQWSGRFKADTTPKEFKYSDSASAHRGDAKKQTTTVVNVRLKHLRPLGYKDLVEWTKNPNNVYIGRDMTHYVPGAVGSMWHNPFKDKQFGRDECVRKYKEYIKTNKQLQSNGRTLLDSLHELKGKTLGCWCHPERCHGHALVELIEEYCSD